jgi:hypothetical protein
MQDVFHFTPLSISAKTKINFGKIVLNLIDFSKIDFNFGKIVLFLIDFSKIN